MRREFAALLDCGILARGFLRVRCPRCRDELLVAFSCKGRGFCPSCGGRCRILAAITQGEVIRAILAALGLPTEPPALHPARGPAYAPTRSSCPSSGPRYSRMDG